MADEKTPGADEGAEQSSGGDQQPIDDGAEQLDPEAATASPNETTADQAAAAAPGDGVSPDSGAAEAADGEGADAAAAAALAAAQAAISQINDDTGDGGDDAAAIGEGGDPADVNAAMGDSGGQVDVDEVAAQAAAGPMDAAGNDGTQVYDLPDFTAATSGRDREPIDLLNDVNLNVKIELGRTRMLVEDVLRLAEGSVVELDKLAGDPVDIYVNERHVAKGEVLVLNDTFCVRVNEIVNGPTTQNSDG
jgi:flagellar motor switch protein FliN/FliY